MGEGTGSVSSVRVRERSVNDATGVSEEEHQYAQRQGYCCYAALLMDPEPCQWHPRQEMPHDES